MTAHPETPRLGYIGLGNQGAPMAKRLLDWPGGLTVFDVRVEAMAPFVEGGATAAASVSDVAEADIISITVFDDAQVSSVITADNGLATHAKPGTIVAIHSTIADDSSRSGRKAQAAGDPHRGCTGQRRRGGGRQG